MISITLLISVYFSSIGNIKHLIIKTLGQRGLCLWFSFCSWLRFSLTYSLSGWWDFNIWLLRLWIFTFCFGSHQNFICDVDGVISRVSLKLQSIDTYTRGAFHSGFITCQIFCVTVLHQFQRRSNRPLDRAHSSQFSLFNELSYFEL